ncbi:ferredoxin [Mycolicibacter kumamotonensis]|uniref:Ferredoxin n=1 Tax=Mycolicibacter kumamotonensis TaxID=354243 RepID=A0A1B8SI32_9MYCO|nr:ferredoxin [Mycolicibacter kumamotonensis]OBY32377.1 hypothetical protein ACT18_07740 [Mycolicibacter kumamotonensis]
MVNVDGTDQAQVVVDQDICMAAGYCYGRYPGLFAAGDLGIAELTVDGFVAGGGPVELTSADLLSAARQASQACPSGAIRIVESGTR